MTETADRLDVIAVAPHPDDLEITCGGTLAKLVRQGYRVGIIDLTNGEPTPRGTEEIRAREAEAARQVLGVHVRVNLGLPNRVLMDSPEGRFDLGTELRRFRPSVLITVAGRTPAASPDHHQGHLLTEAGRFYSQLTKWDDRFADTTALSRAAPRLCADAVRRGTAPLAQHFRDRHYGHARAEARSDSLLRIAIRCRPTGDGQALRQRPGGGATGRVVGSVTASYSRCRIRLAAPDLVRIVRGAVDTPTAKPGQGHLPMG